MHSLLRGTFVPALIFVTLVIVGLLNPDLIYQTETRAVTPVRIVLSYLIPIALWLSGAWLLIRLTNALFWDQMVAKSLGRPVPRLLKDFLAFLIMLAALTAILGFVFETSVTAIWATSSVVTVVIGLALRGIILDFFTGLAINIDRTFQIGDWLEIQYRDFRSPPIFGKVAQITWRNTLLELENKNTVIIPNGLMGFMPLTNYSVPDDLTRFEILIVLDYSVPADRAMRILLAATKASVGQNGPVADPEPRVLVGDATDIGVRYRVRYFARVNTVSPNACRHTVLKSILGHLHAAGLTPAYQKRDVFYSRMPGRNVDLTEGRDLVPLLLEVELFAITLHRPELEELADNLHRHLFAAGASIIRQGESGDSMFVLAEGLALVYVDSDKNGERIKVSQIIPGQAFGEMSLLTGEPRSATVVAATDVVAFEIAKEKMQRILERRPEAVESISQVVARRRTGLSQILTGATTHVQHADHGPVLEKIKRFFSSVFGTTHKA